MEIIGIYYLRALNNDGFEYAITKPLETGEAAEVVVKDPVQCSSGSRRWTEYKEVTMTSDAQVRRFLDVRS